jgi:RNA exonuclease
MELENHLKYFETPLEATNSPFRRAAVAIDCEMGYCKLGDPELIRITLVDYFTSEILIDKLVQPKIDMEDYNTRFSGINLAMLQQAVSRGEYIDGRDAAREAVWKFVGPETIVIGHSADNDLKALRWIHRRVVDTYVLEQRVWDEEQTKKRVGAIMQNEGRRTSGNSGPSLKRPPSRLKGSGPLCLKTAAKQRLGREIQRTSHDSREDALASRDVAKWHVVNSSK